MATLLVTAWTLRQKASATFVDQLQARLELALSDNAMLRQQVATCVANWEAQKEMNVALTRANGGLEAQVTRLTADVAKLTAEIGRLPRRLGD